MVTTWVKEALEDIPAEMVKKNFLKTGISNSVDGTEDDHIIRRIIIIRRRTRITWDTDERLTEQECDDLFDQSDDEDFEGFV